jgi:hypothetical protein
VDHVHPECSESQEQREMEDIITTLPLFECLSRDSLKIVASCMRFKILQAGETPFNEWDRANYACFIGSGALDVMLKSGPDTSSVLRALLWGRTRRELGRQMVKVTRVGEKITVCLRNRIFQPKPSFRLP